MIVAASSTLLADSRPRGTDRLATVTRSSSASAAMTWRSRLSGMTPEPSDADHYGRGAVSDLRPAGATARPARSNRAMRLGLR
jgi:hypothetical protein